MTTSADGRTLTTQLDPSGTGSFTQSRTDTKLTAADGGTTETISNFNASSALTDKTIVTVSGDGLITTISRDANGDGTTDQTQASTRYVDGSSSMVTSDLGSGGTVLDKATMTTSFDGLVLSTSRDFNNDGITDQTSTDATVDHADGSSVETIQTDQTSQQVSGVWHSITPVLLKTVTIAISADGKTRTVTTDVDGNGSTDETLDGSHRDRRLGGHDRY